VLAIKQVLAPLNVKEKLAAQTYDRAAVMSSNVRAVQTLLKDSFLTAELQCATKLWPVGKQENRKGSCSLSVDILSCTLERQHFLN
jgi:hypothetical protein